MARHERGPAVKVVELDPAHEPQYLVCLEDWPGSDLLEAGDHKARWLARMRDRGLVVKLALDEAGRAVGMIQSLPIERSPALGTGLSFVLCVWVLPRRPGGESRQGHGIGSALLEAVEAEARSRGAHGMAAWGLALPVWMKASWFRRHGYRTADRQGLSALLWKPFDSQAGRPRWPSRTGRVPEPLPGKVVVSGCLSGWCPAQNLAFERARRAAALHGGQVEVRLVDTADRETMLAWGCSEALFVDGRPVRTGPPPSQAKLDTLLRRRVARLGPAPAPPHQASR